MKFNTIESGLPIDYMKVKAFETCEVLIVSGGKVEYCEFSCGNLPEPWFKFDNYHLGFIGGWCRLSDIDIEI